MMTSLSSLVMKTFTYVGARLPQLLHFVSVERILSWILFTFNTISSRYLVEGTNIPVFLLLTIICESMSTLFESCSHSGAGLCFLIVFSLMGSVMVSWIPQLCSPMWKAIVWLRAICTVCYCSDDHFSVCIFESELKIVLMSFDLFLKFILTQKNIRNSQ